MTSGEVDPVFGEVIYSYTRAQAIEDGELVDLTAWAKETGFRIPVAVTASLWTLIDADGWDALKAIGQDTRGRAHDVLWMLYLAAKRGGRRIAYKVIFLMPAPHSPKGYKQETRDLIAVCGPGDNGEPVITVMLPDDE